MKIQRMLDGKIYEVRGETDAKYLINDPKAGGGTWILKDYSDVVEEDE